MSYYSTNHLQANWEADDLAYRVERVAAAEQEAGGSFDRATRRQKTTFDAAMLNLLGMTGPKWDRARDAAKAEWFASTAEARALYDRSVEELLATGEVSEELDEAWTALNAPRLVVVGDHAPELLQAAE